MRKIKVIIKEPGGNPRSVNISRRLENLQKTVGGYIETVTLASDLVVICNEEGRLKGLAPNCNICGVDFVGTIILAGVNGDEFGDIPITYQEAKTMFRNLFEEPRCRSCKAWTADIEDKTTGRCSRHQQSKTAGSSCTKWVKKER